MKFVVTVLWAAAILADGIAVNQTAFKKCEQSSFYRRCRKVETNNSPYELLRGTLSISSDSITADLANKNNGHIFVLKVEGIQGDIFRVTIDEKTPLRKRFRVSESLKGPVKTDTVKVIESETDIVITFSKNKAVINVKPFKIDFYRNEVLYVSANAKGLFKFEHYRTKPADGAVHEGEADYEPGVDDEPGAWEEEFDSFHDSKPFGPEAVALDFTFPEAEVLFGIPEHADSFALRPTLGGEPYRLYNLDVAYYEVNNGMSLYGAVPVIYGHGARGTAGVFWMNSAETWIDIYNRTTKKDALSMVMSESEEEAAAHFMSESGIVNTFILLGETPQNTFKQYTDLTGVVPLPPNAALAFHQSRWNYNSEIDVLNVTRNFDVHDIPLDTMWLDIEYTDDKKYFTWDPNTFPHPLEMIGNLTEQRRHLTIIIDPHIKAINSYFVHNDCTENGYYTKDKDGNDFVGSCWPGNSSYADWFNPVVRKYFADRYLLENFKTTTKDVFIWNDMNEPSVFDGPEMTMPKDNIHKTETGPYEHRVVHNMYGLMHVMSTFNGLVRRGHGKLRPFILTRSHFSGSQRYAAIWTGDNTAEWGHLQVSLKMCLTQAVSGFSFCGADVGGFLNEPTNELVERWHQTGAFFPFFRAHSHIDTKRREPWLYPEPTKLIIRDAIRRRYTYLPLWYVLFYEHEIDGYPVMRPLLTNYPNDPGAFAIDNQFLLGDKLLVHPVTQEGATKVDVYFPRNNSTGEGDLWYDVDDYTMLDSAGYVSIPVDSYKIPVYQRGGTIIPKREHVRSASTLMKDDPITLITCLDRFKRAHGTLYEDDHETYEYREGKYIYLYIDFESGVLSSKKIDSQANFKTSVSIEQIIIAGLDEVPRSATLSTASKLVDIAVIKQGSTYSIRELSINIGETWEITLNY